MLSNLEEHWAVFPEPPVTAFQLCKSFKDILVRARLTDKDHKIEFAFTCDSSNAVYLIDCIVCGFLYVGSTTAPFRYRFSN